MKIISLVLNIKLCFYLLLNIKVITACNEIPAKLLSCKAAFWGRVDERQGHSLSTTLPAPASNDAGRAGFEFKCS